MPEALDVSCPCCGALLKVDPETGAVVWADKKQAPAKNFDELVSRVASQKDVLEELLWPAVLAGLGVVLSMIASAASLYLPPNV